MKKEASKKKRKSDIGSSSVSLRTWGTHPDGGNGMTRFMDATFFGKNVGHAALTLSFPADETGERLISEYCIKKTELGQFELGPDGKAVIQIPFDRHAQNVVQENTLRTRDYFSVYFSWWPAQEENAYLLEKSPNEDNVAERPGSSAPPLLPDRGQSEERTYHGVLGSKKVVLSTNEISHLRNLSGAQQEHLEFQFELDEVRRQIQTLNLINEKLERSPRITESLSNLLNRCNIAWEDKSIESIRVEINEKLEDLQSRKDDYSRIIKEQKENFERHYSDYLESEVSAIEEGLSSISEMEHHIAMAKFSEKFSPQALSRYEIEKISRQKYIANQIQILCAIDINLNPADMEGKEQNMYKIRLLQEVFFYPGDNRNRKSDDPQKRSNISDYSRWREFLPAEYTDVTEADFDVSVHDYDTAEGRERIERVKNIIDGIYANATRERNRLVQPVREATITYNSIMPISDPLDYLDNENYVTRGHRHDQEIFLPVGGISEGENVKHGLNIEKMLRKMHALTEDEKGYSTFAKNCSTTVGAILAEGAEPELKSYFKDKAWGAFGTPQEVHNSALKYTDAVLLHDGKKPTKDRIAEYNPLNAPARLAGMTLRKLVDPATPTVAKVGLGVAMVPTGLLAGATEAVKSFADPNDTFQRSRRLISYAATHDSPMLKMSIPVVGLVAGLVAPLAGIQSAIQKVRSEPVADHLSEEELHNLSEKDPHTAQEPYVDERRYGFNFVSKHGEFVRAGDKEGYEPVLEDDKDEGYEIVPDDENDEGIELVSEDDKDEAIEIVSEDEEDVSKDGSRKELFFSDYHDRKTRTRSEVSDEPDESPSPSRRTKPGP